MSIGLYNKANCIIIFYKLKYARECNRACLHNLLLQVYFGDWFEYRGIYIYFLLSVTFAFQSYVFCRLFSILFYLFILKQLRHTTVSTFSFLLFFLFLFL